MSKNLYDLSITEASELLTKKEISSLELTDSVLARIEEKEPEINAFITVTGEFAREKAKKVDEKRTKGEKLSKIAGIPYSLKDVYNTIGFQTTAGSKILEGYISPYNATVFQKLEDNDAVLVGKTNCDSFGFGTSTENSDFGVTKNPIDTSRVPGGSSGGSGAATAYGGGLFSIAEDTGGSIRCPASFCNLVGLKPTYGRVSRYGAIAYASSYDTVGPMTKNVEDNALILEHIAGLDDKDATTSPNKVEEYTKNLNNDISNKTIGLPKEYFGDGIEAEVREVIEKAVEKFKSLGCKIKEVSLPYTEYAIAAYYVVGISEASSNLGRLDGVRYGLDLDTAGWLEKMRETRGQGFNAEAKRRIMVGSYALSAGYADEFYKKAQKVRQLLKQDFARVLNEVDILLTPTMPMLPFKIGENTSDPLKMWLADAFTVTLNPSGLPGLSVPAGMSKEGLPVGMQLIGPHFSESMLYNFAYKYETL
jgi:aspartyl-tRNA(Asn)/glutamyl-tRNA(Gln) amidotransferase subunit A